MSFSDKANTEDGILEIDGTSLNETNLTGLTSTDFHTLSQLSQELTLNTEMETDELVVESQGEDVVHEEEVQTEIGGEEIEIETELEAENAVATIAITEDATADTKKAVVPPLRPLTIAPKPAKIPVTMKPLGGGQQLLLLQGSGSGTQAIKLVSPQGQELSLANLSLTRPVTIKPAIKTITSQGNISLVQQKPVVMKKILTTGQKIQKPLATLQGKQGQQYMVVQKSDQTQQLKLIQGTSIQTLPSPTKTITFQQAQEMGLLSTKMLPTQGAGAKTAVLFNQKQQKTIKIVPQAGGGGGQTIGTVTAGGKTIALKSPPPAKILPAAAVAGGKAQQRIVFKTGGGGQAVLPAGQIIQLAGNQSLNSGQLHQINIPGKGMQYIKFVTTSNAEGSGTTINTIKTTTQAMAGNQMILSELKPVIAPKTLKTIPQKISTGSGGQQMVVTYTVPQMQKVAIPQRHAAASQASSAPKPASAVVNDAGAAAVSSAAATADSMEPNGIRPRKPCNCTKSQCLKLYCDCFANGEFCYMCNCMNCFNNLENEDHRQRAIKACLERNPHAFRPKIGKSKDAATGEQAVRKHTKGCNCKRSGCLKNYCECYEAKIACSSNCKCVGCRNIEDTMEKKNIRITSIIDSCMSNTQPMNKMIVNKDPAMFRPRRSSSSGKQPINFITEDVIEATCQCLLTISDSAESNMQEEELTKRQIIEEFGRCLTEIIECSSSRHLN
ncbi:unnamed protein product [Brassicogethes aeneus]|uniref:CRC domain-containing protein n=1 Tax=Brassicogethes aeneus TaxID=1431903 RepID=A0A9P0FR51_BRAAE|nr:unnamed protein product [Brassicogethes aeneus]